MLDGKPTINAEVRPERPRVIAFGKTSDSHLLHSADWLGWVEARVVRRAQIARCSGTANTKEMSRLPGSLQPDGRIPKPTRLIRSFRKCTDAGLGNLLGQDSWKVRVLSLVLLASVNGGRKYVKERMR